MPEIAHLTDPQSPFRIEYSRPVMERIRGQACDGLLALPRIGMGVGGLLLGVRQDGLVQLMDSIEIHCSHASGPGFLLTADEKERARELIAGAGIPGVIGWYCSKPRGAAVLSDVDMAFFKELFPNREQIALVLRPSTVEPTRAVFFFRSDNGEVVKGIECELDEWREEPVVTSEATSDDTHDGPDEEVVAPDTAVEAEASEPEPLPPIPPGAPKSGPVAFAIASVEVPEPPLRRTPPPPQPSRPRPDPDMFAFASPPPRRNKLRLWIGGVAIILALSAAAWFTQDSWIPRAPLNLTSTELDGNLVIRWNANAFRGIDHASLNVNDDGELHSLPLDRFMLNQGVYHYTHGPRSLRVTARLAAGEDSGIAVWLAPARPAPVAQPSTGSSGGTGQTTAPAPVVQPSRTGQPAAPRAVHKTQTHKK
jgi:hypothetical protein